MLPNPIFLNVHMYGVCIAVGLLFAFGVLYLYAKKLNINTGLADFVFYDGIATVGFGFFSSALFQAVYNYIEYPEDGFRFGSGITFIGGLIGGVFFFLLCYLIFRKKLPGKLSEIVNVIPCCIVIGHAFGRLGCFCAGCCYGKETDSIWGMKFPDLPNKVLPTQLYESLFLFLLFGVLSYLCLKKKNKHILPLYFISYGTFRFLLEFLRGDDRGALLGILSPSQFWCIWLVVAGFVMIFLMPKLLAYYRRKKGIPEPASTETADTLAETEDTANGTPSDPNGK